MENEEKRHMSIAIRCPNVLYGGHAAFSVQDGKFICDCGQDFTQDAKDVLEFIKQSLKK